MYTKNNKIEQFKSMDGLEFKQSTPKAVNMYMYKVLKLLLAYNFRYKIKHCINNINSLDHRLLIVHPNIILPIYTDI